jgi:hypothetical protein
MANPTSNFGWQMPTPVDLVTDLPADFEVFGQAVDTSLADLKGGTTDQVLAKNSNTDMDFKWVTTDDANAIQNAIVNAKGDIIGASANDVPAITSVGANGETLVADSSTTTGLRYTAGTVQANPVLNSAMQVWQRGTSFAITTPVYTADRWQAARAANASGSTVTRQVTNDTTNLPNIQYCLRQQRDSGNAGTGTMYLSQSFESINSIPFAGKTITVSYYARCGADFSPTSSIVNFKLQSGTGTDQNNLTGAYTGSANVTNVNTTLTTTWQRFSSTGTVAATATELAFLIEHTPTGTAGAADFFEVTGLQIDIGSVALPFRTYAATIQGELAACQRYYYLAASGTNQPISNGNNNSATLMRSVIPFPVTMRVAPSLVASSGTNFYQYQCFAAADVFNSLTLGDVSTNSMSVFNNTEISGVGGQGGLILTNNASASVAFSAEL